MPTGTHNGVAVTTHSTPAQTITSIKFNNTFSLSTICDIKPLTNQQIYIIPEYGNESVARVVYNGLRAYKPIILCSTRFACGLKYVKSGMYVVLCEMCELHDFECYAVLDDKCERVVVVDVEKGRAIIDSTNENVVKYYQMRYGTVEVRKTGGVMMNDEECAQRLSADNAALCGVTAGDREQNMENIVNGPVASALKDAVERKDGAIDEKSEFGSGANRTDVTAKHSSDCQPIGEEGLVKHTGNDHEPCGCTPGTGQTRTKSTTVTPHNTERAHSFTTEFDRVKFLVSRLSRVEKVKHLNIFGIYFTNFKLEQFAYKIKEYLVSRGKKVYMYYLRDISYERLTCMDGIECVVIVDCRYHTRFDINIGMPIVVPFELNLAFDGERWDGAYDVNTFNDAGADGNECTDMIACDYYSTGELIKRNEDQCVNFYVEQFDDRIHDGLDGIAGSYKQMGER